MSQELAKFNQNQIAEFKKEFADIIQQSASNLMAKDTVDSLNVAIIIKGFKNFLSVEKVEYFFIELMNTQSGFLTDADGKKKPLYSVETVRNVLIDGIIAGFQPIKNEINIIAGRLYITKEGFANKLNRLGIPHQVYITPTADITPDLASFNCKINYEINNKKETIILPVYIRKTQYAGYDQLRGKAEARALRELHKRVTGLDLGDSSENEIHDTQYNDVTHEQQAQQTIVTDPQQEIYTKEIEDIFAIEDKKVRFEKFKDFHTNKRKLLNDANKILFDSKKAIIKTDFETVVTNTPTPPPAPQPETKVTFTPDATQPKDIVPNKDFDKETTEEMTL